MDSHPRGDSKLRVRTFSCHVSYPKVKSCCAMWRIMSERGMWCAIEGEERKQVSPIGRARNAEGDVQGRLSNNPFLECLCDGPTLGRGCRPYVVQKKRNLHCREVEREPTLPFPKIQRLQLAVDPEDAQDPVNPKCKWDLSTLFLWCRFIWNTFFLSHQI